jgi:hypothetical protein
MQHTKKYLMCPEEELRPVERRSQLCVQSPLCHSNDTKIGTHSHQLRQPTDTLMRHELILHKRKCRGNSTSRKISRQSIEAHGEEDRIATAAGPVQRVRRA